MEHIENQTFTSIKIDVSAFTTLTSEKLVELSARNPLLKIESEGKTVLIINSAINNFDDQRNLTRLLIELGIWNESINKNEGELLDSGSSIEFPDGSGKMPDITYILKEKLRDHPKSKVLLFIPDFVAEYVSTYDSLKEAQQKMEFYMKNNVPLAWLIVPKEDQTYIYQPNTEVKKCAFHEVLDSGNVLQGFKIVLSEIFE
ncbi:MAG: Uma2 family endonuclease [Bacteroidetes bacterium]|nr:MAG: Uma2 family endonuclease [Bacteroidota bacterium]